MLLLLVACAAPPADAPVADSADTPPSGDTGGPTSDWGIASDCATPSDASSWMYAARVVVYGSPEEAAIAGELAQRFGATTVVAAADATDDDLASDLVLVGTPATNPALGSLNGTLPVWFTADGFRFAGYDWEEYGHGIALAAPNPLAEGHRLWLFAGNSLEGVLAADTLEDNDAAVTVARGSVLQLQGELCRDTEPWTWFAPYGEDRRADWDAWTYGLAELSGASHRIRYPPGLDPTGGLPDFVAARDALLDGMVARLAVAAPPVPITNYLYPDNATKGAVTGNEGDGHANPWNAETHEIYEPGNLWAAHEDAHVVAWFGIGAAGTAFASEGLAVLAAGDWQGAPLDDWAEAYAAEDAIPALRSLVEDFWLQDLDVAYPMAGHFLGYVEAGAGIDTVKALYGATDVSTFEDVLGMPIEEAEAAWQASVGAR